MSKATKNRKGAKARLTEATNETPTTEENMTETATVEATPDKPAKPAKKVKKAKKLSKAQMVAKLKAQALKIQQDLAQAQVEAEIEQNPKLAALAARLKDATSNHKSFHRLIVLREKKIRNAEKALVALRDGKFDETGKLEAEGLKQILEGQTKAAKILAKVQKEVDAARADFAPEAPKADTPESEG